MRTSSGQVNGSDGPARRVGVGGRRGVRWHSHTYADGVHAITLASRLEPALAGALRARLAELIARGCRRLIVDAAAIGPLDRDERLLFADALAGVPTECRIVVVVPWRFMLHDVLPDRIWLVQSFDEARARLGAAPLRATTDPGLSGGDRQALTLRQSLRWAEQAAAEGDYENALSWLTAIEAIQGELPRECTERRRAWRHASLERHRGARLEPDVTLRYVPRR